MIVNLRIFSPYFLNDVCEIWHVNSQHNAVYRCSVSRKCAERKAVLFIVGVNFNPTSACTVKLHGTLQLNNSSVISIRCVLRLQHFRFVSFFILHFPEVIYSLGSAVSLSRDVTAADLFLKPRVTQRRHLTV